MTSWDEPYIGDESMSRPPPWKNARITSAQESRPAGSSPTLNVIQLPSPTSGSRSPVDGIGRVRIAPLSPAGDRERRADAAPVAARDESRVRRVSVGRVISRQRLLLPETLPGRRVMPSDKRRTEGIAPRCGCRSRGSLAPQALHVDDEPVADVAPDGPLPGLVDLLDRDHLDVGSETVPGAEVQHLLRLADAADARA